MTNNEIKIDVSLIPNHVKDQLSIATLNFIKELILNPKTNKSLKEKMKRRKEHISCNLKSNPKG